MTKKIMRSAIDAGFRWSAAHKEEREQVLQVATGWLAGSK